MQAAKFCGFFARIPYLLRRRMPVGWTMLGQKTHAQTGCIDQPDTAFLCEGGQNPIHIRVQEIVVTVGKDAIDRRGLGYPPQQPGRITRDANVARLALRLQLPQSGEWLMYDMLYVSEPDIMHLEQIDV